MQVVNYGLDIGLTWDFGRIEYMTLSRSDHKFVQKEESYLDRCFLFILYITLWIWTKTKIQHKSLLTFTTFRQPFFRPSFVILEIFHVICDIQRTIETDNKKNRFPSAVLPQYLTRLKNII